MQIIAASQKGQAVLNCNQHILFVTPITALWIVFSKRKLKNAHSFKLITLVHIYNKGFMHIYTCIYKSTFICTYM